MTRSRVKLEPQVDAAATPQPRPCDGCRFCRAGRCAIEDPCAPPIPPGRCEWWVSAKRAGVGR